MTKNTGFTLIEVLIAMVILAIGLLGLAGLQATSLRNTQSAYFRSEATQLAYGMADRMRANAANARLLAGSAYLGAGTQVDTCKAAPGCTPAQMAQNDVYEWNQYIDNALGVRATGTIAAVPVAAPTGFTITINWDDNRDDNVDASDPNFQMSFRL